jgi:hypothetical protein
VSRTFKTPISASKAFVDETFSRPRTLQTFSPYRTNIASLEEFDWEGLSSTSAMTPSSTPATTAKSLSGSTF